MDSSIATYLQDRVLTYKEKDRAIVFCRSIQNVTSLAKLLKVHPFSSPGDDEKKLEKNREAMVKWISGENNVMTSTSILGCGIDYPHIRDVIHRDPSFTMIDQYQEDSRGGRDGVECRATTFVVDKKHYKVPSDKEHDMGTQALYDSMYELHQCRRIAPGLYFDGRAIQCINIVGAVFCDFCEKASKSIAPASKARPTSLTSHIFPPPRRSTDIFDPEGVIPRSPLPPSNIIPHVSPPRRSNDIFDPQGDVTGSGPSIPLPRSSSDISNPYSTAVPRLDLRQAIRPLKRNNFFSFASSPSNPAKRVKISDSMTIESSRLPTPVSVAPRPARVHPAGIQARQHQLAAQERLQEFKTKIDQPAIKALSFLQDKCIMCRLTGQEDWQEHSSDNCPARTATNYGDPAFKEFRNGAFRLPGGWCFSCLIHQVCSSFLFFFLTKRYFLPETHVTSVYISQGLPVARYYNESGIYVHRFRHKMPVYSSYLRPRKYGRF